MVETSLYHGDSLELLGNIPDGSVDLVLTDPPYNISQDSKSLDRSSFRNRKMRRASKTTLDYGDWDKRGKCDFIDFTRSWFGEVTRCLRDGGTLISFFSREDFSMLSWIGEEFGVRFRNFFTWVKTNPMPSVYRRNYLSACEVAYIGSKGEAAWTFNFTTQQEMHNVFFTPNKSIYGVTNHPNEKPLALLEHFLRVHTNEGMTVLDCFMGSGSTGVACVDTNRNFIGIEKDDGYFRMAKERISKHRSMPKQVELL